MIYIDFYTAKIREEIKRADKIEDEEARIERKIEILRSVGRVQEKASKFLEELKREMT